ncbi:MAG: response regulator, partial [Candidatus Omnitrophica bacterium]|nr:response regulator [Candidatus Omnitrophota bacterium]
MIEEHEANGDIFPDGPLNILYLDDNEQALEYMKRALYIENKINLLGVRNWEQFSAQLNKTNYNCLILDYSAKGVNIFDAVYNLFKSVPRRPIIIVSGVLDEKLSASFQDFPFLKFIPKY